MSISINTVITQALQEPGIIAWDEQADGDHAAMAVSLLNQVVAQLNTEQLLPFSRRTVSYTPATSLRQYSIGVTNPASDIAYERPLFINKLLYQTNSSSNPIEILQIPYGDLMSMQILASASGTPRYFAYNATYPAGELHLDICPSPGAIFKLIYNVALERVTSQTDNMSWPDEYQDLITMALARKLGSKIQCPVDTLNNIDKLYKEAKDRVKTLNARSQVPMYLYGTQRPIGFKGNLLAGI